MRAAAWLWRWAAFLLRLEISMYVGLARLVTRRPDVPTDSTPHRYVGSVSALLWAFTGVSAVELVVLHLVIPWESVRLAADILGIWGLVWVAGLTARHYVYPHLATPEGLRVRAASRRDVVVVPWSSVTSVATRERGLESSRSPQLSDGVLHVGAGSRTNVDLRLLEPVTVTLRSAEVVVHEVRVFADDPRGLVAAYEAARASEGRASQRAPEQAPGRTRGRTTR